MAVSPDSKWITVAKQDRTLRSHVYIVPIGGGEERHISDDTIDLSPRTRRCGPPTASTSLFTSTEGFSNGIATQGGITASTELWVLALRDRDRDPGNRDIDNEAQGLAAQAEARAQQRRRQRGAGSAHRLERAAAARQAAHRAGQRDRIADRRRPKARSSR